MEFTGLPFTRIWGAVRAQQVIPAREPAAGLKLDPAICVMLKQWVSAAGNSGQQPALLETPAAGWGCHIPDVNTEALR